MKQEIQLHMMKNCLNWLYCTFEKKNSKIMKLITHDIQWCFETSYQSRKVLQPNVSQFFDINFQKFNMDFT